jgi:DNA-binding transcriptional MocR family regulator
MIEDNVIAALEQRVTAAAPGERLPSVRELMAIHRVGPATVQRAVAQLAARGLVEARPGHGTFVAAPRSATAAPDLAWQTVALGGARVAAAELDELLKPPPPGALVLSAGYLPPDLQPTGALSRALSRAARRPGAWDRGPLEGIEPLRAWFAAEAGGGVTAADVIVCPGGQPALGAALRGLVAPGGTVLVESPTYLGAIVAARAAGLKPVPVPTDADGVRPDLLADAFAATGARAVYLQPAVANPHGATLAADRRAAVLDAARAAGAFVIEDDASRDLHLGPGGAAPPLLRDDRDGHVVHLRSLTKPAAPGLRVAGLTARGPAGARLRAARIVEDFYVTGVLQEAAVELVTAPAWRRHLNVVRSVLTVRRDALLAALAPTQLTLERPPTGGMHAWVRLPDGTDELRAAESAARAGVVVSPGRPWFVAEPPAPYLRLPFAAETPERLALGVERLASCVAGPS